MLYGWRALPMTEQHVLRDGLHDHGRLVATVEAFDDDGPWYANAIAPDGQSLRGGGARTYSDAAKWCERVSGYVPTTAG